MRILMYVLFLSIYYFAIRGLIRKIFGYKNKTNTKEYYRNLNDNIDSDKAFSPVMYNQPIEGVAKEFIKNELNQHGFGMNDSIPELEMKKSIIAVIVTIIILIVEIMTIFRINKIICIMIIIPTILCYILAIKKYNIFGLLYKEFNAREDENMEYIISSYIQHRVKKIPFIIGRLAFMIVIIMIPLIMFNKPRFFYEKTEGGYSVRFYAGLSYPEEIEVPDTYEGEKVVGIRGNVFKNIKNVNKIIIPDTVVSINGHAFENDTNLQEVVLSKNLTYLGAYAFNNCKNLKKINIPESIKAINAYTFNNNKSLEKVEVNGSFDKVGAYAFAGTSNLIKVDNLQIKELGAGAFENSGITEGIELLEGMYDIPAKAFHGSAIESIYIPNTIKKIGESAFEASKLQDISLPYGLEYISESAFRSSKIRTIVIPDSVTKISAHAFRECYNLTYVKLSKKITEIKASTFRSTNIDDVIIPDGVTTIGESAFRGNSLLSRITIPDSVQTIGDKAFRDCPSLKSIILPLNVHLGEKVFKDSPTTVTYGKNKINTNTINIDDVIEKINNN